MCLSLIETKSQREERMLLWLQDNRRLGDLTLECRDARGQVSHSVVVAVAASRNGQQVVQAVLRDHPQSDSGERRPRWKRDADTLDRRPRSTPRQLTTASALLAHDLCSRRIAQQLRRGLSA